MERRCCAMRQFYLIVDGPGKLCLNEEVVLSIENGIKAQGSRGLAFIAVAAEIVMKSSCCEVVSFFGFYEEGDGDDQRVCRAHGIYAPCTRKGRIMLEIPVSAARTD